MYVDVLDSVQMDSGSKSIRTESSTKKQKKRNKAIEKYYNAAHFYLYDIVANINLYGES